MAEKLRRLAADCEIHWPLVQCEIPRRTDFVRLFERASANAALSMACVKSS
jgi:hypothetical protein